ncbi:hypothetical protein D1BOALGB6SA_515 [Olavius sp. associated proteobacterium Delta 1]|nr:hypothetical protein D1BOALGB6SA_515 [Olavius sp. associated proteobacterium Delta 1]
MPRTPRMVIADETTVYHVMSRTALDGFPRGDIEKDFKQKDLPTIPPSPIETQSRHIRCSHTI